MREIKFRQRINRIWHYFELKNGLCEGVASASLEHHPIMQYTGIKDKNGVEIYEGDILWDEHHEEIEIVRFKNGQFCTEGYSCDDISDLKKIGNIYENPELLVMR